MVEATPAYMSPTARASKNFSGEFDENTRTVNRRSL